jgi:hypothetical protein
MIRYQPTINEEKSAEELAAYLNGLPLGDDPKFEVDAVALVPLRGEVDAE